MNMIHIIFDILAGIGIYFVCLVIRGVIIGIRKGRQPKFIVDEFGISHKIHDLKIWDNTCGGCVERYKEEIKKQMK